MKKKPFFRTLSIRLLEVGFGEKSIQSQNLNHVKFRICAQSTEQKNRSLSFTQNSKVKKNFIKKKLLYGYSKIHELKLVTIGLASPEKIKSWAEKELPNGKTFGEVTNANTFHYRTFKPSKGGLFCERIFGPMKDFECACGKRQKPTALESKKILEHEQTQRSFCPNCDVEYTWSIIRRYQLGYIKLNAPVVHLWYFKTNPSYLSILFDMKRKHLESIIYCTEPITIENTWKYSEQNYSLNRSPSDLYLTWQKFFTMEEKIKKYQIVSKNKQEEQKQKKRVFRNHCSQQNTVQQQINWQMSKKKTFFPSMIPEEVSNTRDFEKKSFFSNILSSAFPSSFSFLFSKQEMNKGSNEKWQKGQKEKGVSVGPKTKNDILLNISKQKRKKFVIFLFQQSWKRILQESYRNAHFLTSTEFLAQEYFINTLHVFEMFYFSSFLFFSSFLCEEKIKKEQNSKSIFLSTNSVENFSAISSLLEDFGNGEEKKRKSVWKSFFFLFQFGKFFLQQKKTKIKIYNSSSKEDIVFLLNILPFLKKMYLFKDLKFMNQSTRKIHSFLFQKSFARKGRKNKKFEKHYDFSFWDKKWTEAQTKTLSKTIKPFLSQHNLSPFCYERAKKWQKAQKKAYVFGVVHGEREDQKKVFWDSKILLKNKKNYSLSFNQLVQTSFKFEKILIFLKSAYRVEFCSVFQNIPTAVSVEENEKNNEEIFLLKKCFQKEDQRFSHESIEVFFNQSKTFSLVRKYSFEYFSFFLFFLQSHQSFPLGIDRSSFLKLSQNFLLFSDENKSVLRTDEKKIFDSNNFKAQPSLFFLLKYMLSRFLIISKVENKKKIVENSNVFRAKFPQQKRKMIISNKPLLSRMKFNQQKKQLQGDLAKKFFHFDIFSKDLKSSSSKGKVFHHRSPFVHHHKKQNEGKSSLSFSFEKKNVQSTKKLKTPGLRQMKINQQKSGEKNFLKNIISTIAYNYSWSNDADWKYFVYYNSFFSYDFEDIPIFLYRSFSPLKNGRKAFMMSEINSSFSKSNEFFSPFLSWSIDSSSKNLFVGAGILEKLLTEYTAFELRKMTKQHQVLLPKINQTLRLLKQNAKTKKDSLKIQKYFQKREHILRRLKFLRKFSRRNSNPTFMILKNLPVLPPDLRPILKLQNQIAASDLNRFYQRIIYRNDRLKKFSKDSATNQSFEIKYAQRLLQEAVDNLIQNGKGSVKAETNSRGQPLKSLSEILKGKQGRFRQYLLGKRVDYSGRSVIVVGPELKLYECGIPKEMALELFLPFLIQYILKFKLAQTVVGAKNLLKSDATFALHLLHKVMKNIPVLLNRAPTLHRLGFQAFLPKLIEGRAILLHPMVCPAFNADFDGDQMAVHIPLTVEARTEAWKFMLSTNNLMNSATGESIILPSQDMVLGCYYLTIDFQSKFVGVQLLNQFNKQKSFGSSFMCKGPREKDKPLEKTGTELRPLASRNYRNFIVQNKSFLFFKNFISVINSYQRKELSLHTPVWVKWNAMVDFGNDFSKPLEIRLQINGSWEQIQPRYTTFYNKQNKIVYKCIRTTPGRILMNLMIQECMKST